VYAKSWTFVRQAFKNAPRLRHPTFQRSSAGLKGLVRLDLRWAAAQRDHQVQVKPRVNRSEALLEESFAKDSEHESSDNPSSCGGHFVAAAFGDPRRDHVMRARNAWLAALANKATTQAHQI